VKGVSRYLLGLILVATSLQVKAADQTKIQLDAPAINESVLLQSQPGALTSASWALRLPQEKQVTFRGALNTDFAGGGAMHMMYYAPSAAGAIAALITHGLLNSGARKLEMNRLQKEADNVLSPYQAIIQEFKHEELFAMISEARIAVGQTRIALAEEAPSTEWFFTIHPVFSMTQDQRALIADVAVSVFEPSKPAAPSYTNTVRVISSPVPEVDPLLFWGNAVNPPLKRQGAELVLTALELVIDQATSKKGDASEEKHSAKNASVQRTVRYIEGGNEKVERAEILRIHCDRALLKTLRGGLMAVPLKSTHELGQTNGSRDQNCARLGAPNINP
jgi:hypothetical protein